MVCKTINSLCVGKASPDTDSKKKMKFCVTLEPDQDWWELGSDSLPQARTECEQSPGDVRAELPGGFVEGWCRGHV